MRCTLGTTVAACVAVLVGLALLPGSPAIHSHSRALADSPKEKTAIDAKDNRLTEVEQLLDTTSTTIAFDDTSLRDVLDFLSETVKVDILPARSSKVELDSPISLRIRHKPVSVRTALELVLEQLNTETSYTIRDGIIFVTEQSLANEMQVYNCRDLLESAAKRPSGVASKTQPATATVELPALIAGAQTAAEPTAKCTVDALAPRAASPAEALIRVITATVDPQSWMSVGGPGSIEEFNGLIVVKQSQQAHRDVRKLLEMCAAPQAPELDSICLKNLFENHVPQCWRFTCW